MNAWAKPGVKCVCVVAGPIGPALNEICTIKEVKPFDDGLYLVLSEYGWVHTDLGTSVERRRPLFRVDRFRPLVSQEDDLALFRHHLNTVEEPA